MRRPKMNGDIAIAHKDYDVTVDSNERIQRIEDELGIAQTDGGTDTEADE